VSSSPTAAPPAVRGAVPPHRAPLLLLLLVASWLLGAEVLLAQPAAVRVAVVVDGPTDRVVFSPELIAREAANVGAGDVTIVFPETARESGDWSLAGAAAALERALLAQDVDVVLTVGMLAAHAAAHREAALTKPVIAPFVADPRLQTFPFDAGTSGRANFTYIADFSGIDEEVRIFHEVVGFTHLAALVDEALLRALPEIAAKAAEIAAARGMRVSLVATGDDVAGALAAVPSSADAVYVTGLLRFDDQALRELASGLAARRLPSFSVIGRTELEQGLLMTTGGAEQDVVRIARRVVLMIERLARGEQAAGFEVGLPTQRRLAINMRTAEAIGFSPRWEYLIDAEQLYGDTVAAEPLTLVEAMRVAVDANPALAASRARRASSAEDTRIARSYLLPSLDLSASRTKIDDDRANPLFQAERTTSTGLTLENVIYSERARSNYTISRHLYDAATAAERQDVLDTLAAAAETYLDLLRAQSAERVWRANVENTRRNLETSRVRETVGVAERSDFLRWVAQLARDKQDLLAAEALRRQGETELARLLHRSADEPIETVESALDEPLAFVGSPRLRAFLDTPAKWAEFMQYVVAAALTQAPELAQANAVVASRERAVTAVRRSAYVPDLAIVSSGSKATSRGGVASGATPGAPDDESWNVALQATLPLFTGRRRSAELAQARHELRASEADRTATADGVEARARAALQRAASSYPSIELAIEAAAAANENLAMVTDAYARGAVSVTELIDAQDTALGADLGAADAKFTFLIDFVAVLRAMGEFDVLLDPSTRESWLERVERFVADRAASAAS
jgi:outer membrane protein